MAASLFTDAHRAVVAVLVEARRQAGVNQADLAAMLGKDQTFVSRLERGQRRIDLAEFFEFAHALGRDPVAMFGEIAERVATSATSQRH